jgi:hypothetical protein
MLYITRFFLLAFFTFKINNACSQVAKFRVVEIDTAYFDGGKAVPLHKSYPENIVAYDLDKQVITIYRYPKNNSVYTMFNFREYLHRPSNIKSSFKARAIDENNEECNVNIYIYKDGKFDVRYEFLYQDKGVVIYLKKL